MQGEIPTPENLGAIDGPVVETGVGLSDVEKEVREKEKDIRLKTYRYQFEYIKKLIAKEIPFVNGKLLDLNLEEAIKNYTAVEAEAGRYYRERNGTTIIQARSDQNVALFKKLVNDQALKLCREFFEQNPNNPDFGLLATKVDEAIKDIVDDVIGKAEKIPEKMKSEKQEVGIINFYIYIPDPKYAKDYGVTEGEKCVEIHFDPLFKQSSGEDEDGSNSAELREQVDKSLTQLAEIIESQHPDIAGVIGNSWLFSVPSVAKAIGFDDHNSRIVNEGYARGGSFWGQFVSGDGRFNETRAKRLVAGKKPRFLVKAGFIPREEFLRKHLKDNK